MNKLTPTEIILVCALGGALLVVMLLSGHCGPSPDPSKPYREELARMQHRYALDSAESAQAYEVKRREADSLGKVAAVSFHNAQRYQRVADSLGRIPRYQPPVVPVTPCDSALAVTVMERDTLRVALDTMTATAQRQFASMRAAQFAADIQERRVILAQGQLSQERGVWEDEREAWRATVKRLKPCKVLGLIGCPTLTVGYGAMLTAGRITTGPTIAVGIPVRLW